MACEYFPVWLYWKSNLENRFTHFRILAVDLVKKYRTQCAAAFFNVNQKTQEVCWYFWVNIFNTNQNFSKKPSVNRAAKILQPKNQFLSNLLKNPKGGFFYVEKILISDFAQISCVEFLGPKYIKFWVSSKSEMKNFLT